jgi:amino acid permease
MYREVIKPLSFTWPFFLCILVSIVNYKFISSPHLQVNFVSTYEVDILMLKCFLSYKLRWTTDLAYQIALDYTHLIGQKDADGMTGLQLLSCNPSAFKLEPEEGFINLGMEV